MKKSKISRYLIISIVFFLFSRTIYSQNYIGFKAGVSKVKFFDFEKSEDFDVVYPFKNAMLFGFFYENKIDSTKNFRVELQYQFLNADMEIKNNSGNSSYYKSLNYSFQQLGINILYSLNIFESKSFKVFLPFGVAAAYTVKTKSKGNGWDFVYQTQIDTNGYPVRIIRTQNWVKNEEDSKDLSQFNFGCNVGVDFIKPINRKIDIIVQNNYTFFLTHIKPTSTKYMSLLSGNLNIAIRYTLR